MEFVRDLSSYVAVATPICLLSALSCSTHMFEISSYTWKGYTAINESNYTN